MRTAARSPQPPELPFQLGRADISALAHDAAYGDVELVNVALCEQHAKGVAFETFKFTKVDLSGSRLDHLRVLDGELSDCNLANVQSRAANATRTTIQTSRLTGLALPEATLRDITIRDCRVDLASFSFSRLARVTFEDCLLAQTDFLETHLESVRFHGCDLTRADFRGARLQHCEFRRSDLSDLQGIQSLRGAAMELGVIVEMAAVWASTLGIEVLDRD